MEDDNDDRLMVSDPTSGKAKEPCLTKKAIIIIVVAVIVVAAALAVILVFVLKKDDQEPEHPECPECGLSMEELQKRTDPKYLGVIKLLKSDSPEYAALKDGDKQALKHLVKAATYLENIEFQIDDNYNIPFKEYLEKEVQKNNTQAKLTKILFDAQKGINALDSLSQEINLAKGHKTKPGIGVYPENLTTEEYQKILIKMLKEKKIEEVRNITNQRSMVFRDGEYLKAVDYVEYFKEDFTKIADELDEAYLIYSIFFSTF